jgi:hypothetical protein
MQKKIIIIKIYLYENLEVKCNRKAVDLENLNLGSLLGPGSLLEILRQDVTDTGKVVLHGNLQPQDRLLTSIRNRLPPMGRQAEGATIKQAPF